MASLTTKVLTSYAGSPWNSSVVNASDLASRLRYAWFPGGVIGALAGITPQEGTCTFNTSTSRVTITGLTAGTGILFLIFYDFQFYYEEATAA